MRFFKEEVLLCGDPSHAGPLLCGDPRYPGLLLPETLDLRRTQSCRDHALSRSCSARTWACPTPRPAPHLCPCSACRGLWEGRLQGAGHRAGCRLPVGPHGRPVHSSPQRPHFPHLRRRFPLGSSYVSTLEEAPPGSAPCGAEIEAAARWICVLSTPGSASSSACAVAVPMLSAAVQVRLCDCCYRTIGLAKIQKNKNDRSLGCILREMPCFYGTRLEQHMETGSHGDVAKWPVTHASLYLCNILTTGPGSWILVVHLNGNQVANDLASALLNSPCAPSTRLHRESRARMGSDSNCSSKWHL